MTLPTGAPPDLTHSLSFCGGAYLALKLVGTSVHEALSGMVMSAGGVQLLSLKNK
jgi:hypothetical protein